MVAIFLVVFVAFLFVANLVVFEAVASIFFLTTSTSLWVLGVSLGMLSVSFLLTTLFGMQFYNTGTRVAYTLSSIWIGFFTYLFLAMVLYGALVVSPFPWAREGGMVLVFLALLLSVYGVLHARKIVVQQVEVRRLGADAVPSGLATSTSGKYTEPHPHDALSRRSTDSRTT